MPEQDSISNQMIHAVVSSHRLRPRTKTIYESAVREFVAYAGGNSRRYNGAMVEAWRDHLTGTGILPQTVNLKLNGLRFATRRLAQLTGEDRWDFARYAEKLRPAQKARRRPLTLEQSRALVAACQGRRPRDIRDRAIVILGLRTGLRRFSICGLKLSDLDGNKLHVTLKGGHEWDVYLDKEALTALHDWLKVLHAAGIKRGPMFLSMSRARTDGLTALGAALTPDGLYRALKARARKAGIPSDQFYPHILRHTFISMAINAGVPTWRIRQTTGQKTDSVIEDYTTDMQGADAPASTALPGFLGGGPVALATVPEDDDDDDDDA